MIEHKAYPLPKRKREEILRDAVAETLELQVWEMKHKERVRWAIYDSHLDDTVE